jgi:MtN3 and saliva related transmembrane protein
MSLISTVGFAAGSLTTLAYLPQALHSFRTRSVRDISLAMLVSLNLGLVLWVAYGAFIHSMPLVLANVLTFALASPLLVMKVRFREKNPSEPKRAKLSAAVAEER